MAAQRILIIEDEEDILALVHYNLVKAGFAVDTATSGEDGLEKARAAKPDLVILDLMLPGIDGLEVCRRLRAEPTMAETAVIMITARGEEEDIVRGLEHGADDYLPKPFGPQVLVARAKAVLRRGGRTADSRKTITVHDIVIDPGRNRVTVADSEVALTVSEFRLLQLLAGRPGWVFSRSQIVDALHGEGYAVSDRAVDVQVVGLRKKLGAGGDCIETVRGVGYRLRDEGSGS